MDIILSSPSAAKFDSFVHGTTTLLHRGELYQQEIDLLKQQAEAKKQARARSRKTLQKGGILKLSEAVELRLAKEQVTREKEIKKAEREAKAAANQLVKQA